MKLNQLLLSATLLTSIASADTTLVYNDADGKESSKMYLSDGLTKITNNTEIQTALVFNSKQNSFTIVNHQDKSFMVFGEKEIAALGDVSAMVDRMLEEQLSQMPAAQREQMRGMMESMIKKQMPKQAPLPEYSKSGETSTYNGFKCDVVIKKVQGSKNGNFCVSDIENLGIDVKEYASIHKFMKTAEKMAAQFGQDQSMNFDAIGQVLPVYYDMGTQKAYLVEVNHEALKPQTFQVPEGYKQQNLPKQMFQ